MLQQRNAISAILALSTALPRGVHSNVLVKEGFNLVKQSSDDSKLTSGGSSRGSSYFSGGDCSSIKYIDTCGDVEGARFHERDGLDGIYVVNGDTVTKCSRYRSEWQCNQCVLGRCTFTSGENFGGATTTYRLAAAPGKIASLTSLDDNGYCYKACTNADGTLAIGDDDAEGKCGKGDGWYLLEAGYDTPCDISGTHECEERGDSCDSFSLSRGWADDCCPGSYCSSDRCRENVRNERRCRTTNQPCGSDADCCVGYACNNFVYESAAKACERIRDDCTQEGWEPDEDEPCCEGTEEAETTDEDGETIVYCKATANAIAASGNSGGGSGGSGGGGENENYEAESVAEEGGVIAEAEAPAKKSEEDSGKADGNGRGVISVSEACADLGRAEAHMTASFKAMVPGTSVTNGYDCKCTEPGATTLVIECSLLYTENGEVFANFERAIFETVSPASTELVLTSIAWGDEAYHPLGVFQETYFYDGAGGNVKSCGANGCAPCEVCPDGASVAVDCGALPGNLAFVRSCDDGTTTTFLADYYRDEPLRLEKDGLPSASLVRVPGLANFLPISVLLMIRAIF